MLAPNNDIDAHVKRWYLLATPFGASVEMAAAQEDVIRAGPGRNGELLDTACQIAENISMSGTVGRDDDSVEGYPRTTYVAFIDGVRVRFLAMPAYDWRSPSPSTH